MHTNLVLSHDTIYRRREALRDLPRTLDSAFTRTLARIREQVQVSQAFIILAWIHHVGPMSLDQLRYALAIEPHHTEFHGDNLPDKKTMLDCCLGLARLDTSERVSSDSEVTLVHSTLSVFFESYPSILRESVSIIADTCLTYLLFEQDEELVPISSLMNGVWLRLLTVEDLTPTKRNKAWRYLQLMNKRMNDQKISVRAQGLPSHARMLACPKLPARSIGQRLRGQTLLHTACMLGLDAFDPILNDISEETTGPEDLTINNTDVLGISALGWTLLASGTDESEEVQALPFQKNSYEHNIWRAERIIEKFPDLDPNQELWDINALDAIRKSDASYKGSTRIEYFARLPFLFFLSNYYYWPDAIGRCMSLMENRSQLNVWSAIERSAISDPRSKNKVTFTANTLVGNHDQMWVLVSLDNEATEDHEERVRSLWRHFQPSSIKELTDDSWPGARSDEPQQDTVTGPSSVFVRREFVALFRPGTNILALVAANWHQDPVSTYCAERDDITKSSSRPLRGISCQTLLLPHRTLLHVGAAADSVRIVKFTLSVLRMDPNMLDHNGTTALQLALRLGSWLTANFLIEHNGIDLTSPDAMGQSPLHLCVQRPQRHRLDRARAASSILSRCRLASSLQDNTGKTALHYAVEYGNRPMVNLLLRHNPEDVNIQDGCGHTPLQQAILRRDLNTCEIILEQVSGSTLSSGNLQVAWALTMSAGASFILPLLRFVRGLVDHQAAIVSERSFLSPATGHSRGILLLVHAASQSPNFTENDLDFMLALESTTSASKTSRESGIIALARGGLSIEPANAAKTIRAALVKGAGSVAAYLLSIYTYAVDLDHIGEDGESALHLAIVYNASQVVQFLLDRSNIDVNTPDSEEYTALQLAVVRKRLDILQMLLNNPRVKAGQVHNSSRETALILAIKHRFTESVPMLLAAHQRIPVNHLDRSGSSALHYAVMQEDTATVRLLLGCPGLVVTTPSRDGRTALAHAAMFAGMEMVSLLLETGDFDLSHRDSYGKTAFDWAQTNPCVEVVEALRTGS